MGKGVFLYQANPGCSFTQWEYGKWNTTKWTKHPGKFVMPADVGGHEYYLQMMAIIDPDRLYMYTEPIVGTKTYCDRRVTRKPVPGWDELCAMAAVAELHYDTVASNLQKIDPRFIFPLKNGGFEAVPLFQECQKTKHS